MAAKRMTEASTAGQDAAGAGPVQGAPARGEPRSRLLGGVVITQTMLVTSLCIAWALSAPQYFGFAFYNEQFLALILGLTLGITFHTRNWRGAPHRGIPWLDLCLGFVGLGVSGWIAVHYPRLIFDVAIRTPEVLIVSSIVIVLVLEGLRRATGWSLLCVVLFFIGYAMVAHLAPEQLRGRTVELGSLAAYLALDPSAVFGSPLVVGATVVIMFIWMGEMLIRSGGGEFFLDVAMAMVGRRRGGPAKICVIGSGLFGLVSGSAVSNVAAVGVLTIPMMKRTGYPAREAGAIEAVGSTGGQLMPPVMGAAAFLMAEFLEVPYANVALAALIPAVLYYWGLYCQVDLMAGKLRLQRLADALPGIRKVIADGWPLIIPFSYLVFSLFYWDHSPQVSGIGATVIIFAVGLCRGYRGKKLRWTDIFNSLAATGRTTTTLFLTLAAAGFIIGVLNVTGLGFGFTLWLVNLAGENLFVLLLITATVSVVLGMGMPTTAVYVLLAALAAPSLEQAGVNKMAAHLFILYFGMLSMITPPVALAAYAAANISGAGVMETAWAAVRIGWAKYVVPFMFVLSPTLIMVGATTSIVYDSGTAFFGVYLVSVAIVGFFKRNLHPLQRLGALIAGAAAIVPDSHFGFYMPGFVSGLGCLIGALVLLSDWLLYRKATASSPSTTASSPP